jgi:Uri superfamily endonuclease
VNTSRHTSYKLHIRVTRPLRLKVGALGELQFPPGHYVYTGSARRDKPLRWHIDYLLADPAAAIERVETGTRAGCRRNQATAGRVLHPRFGASDCRAGCGAHLKGLGSEPAAV